jgi:hypothetical protein
VKIAFGDFAASWFKDRDYAATTRERNAGVLNRHILPTFRAVPLREISTPQVRRRLRGRSDQEGAASAKSVGRHWWLKSAEVRCR